MKESGGLDLSQDYFLLEESLYFMDFGQQLRGEQSPVEHRGNSYPFILPSVCSSLGGLNQALGGLSEALGGLMQPLRGLPHYGHLLIAVISKRV